MGKYYVLKDELFRQETITGSSIEYRVVDKLYKLFKELVDEVKIVETPVDTWSEDKCIIEASGDTIDCRSMPYIFPAEIEASITYADYLGENIIADKPVKDRIVFIPFPDDPDDIKYVVLKLHRNGAYAVVFYDQLPGRYRRMVLIGDEDFSYRHGSPTPIPAVSIRKEDYMRIRKKDPSRVRIMIKTSIKHNVIGKTIIGRIHGAGEKEIHVSAHHDHWFTGFSDNLIGVETLLQIATFYRRTTPGVNIVLISYTAEESGALNYTSWYWTWGSRYYLGILEKANIIDDIIADINVDAIYTTPYGVNMNPALKTCIDKLAGKYPLINRGYDHTDFDSFSYTRLGIPALTINNLKEMKHIYHTDLDDGSEVSENTINTLFNTVKDVIECIIENPPDFDKVVDYLKNNNIIDTSSYRSLIGRIENLVKITSRGKALRIATKTLTTVSYIPGIDGLFESDIMGDVKILLNILDTLESRIGGRMRIKAVDREQILDISPTRYNIEELKIALKHTIEQRILEYHRILDEEIKNILFKKYFKPINE